MERFNFNISEISKTMFKAFKFLDGSIYYGEIGYYDKETDKVYSDPNEVTEDKLRTLKLVRHGSGIQIFTDNNNNVLCKYEGQWINDNGHGKGKIYYPDNSIYEGNINNNKMHGYGKYIWPDNSSYLGNWKHGKMEGKGYFTHYDNHILKGIFKNNFYLYSDLKESLDENEDNSEIYNNLEDLNDNLLIDNENKYDKDNIENESINKYKKTNNIYDDKEDNNNNIISNQYNIEDKIKILNKVYSESVFINPFLDHQSLQNLKHHLAININKNDNLNSDNYENIINKEIDFINILPINSSSIEFVSLINNINSNNKTPLLLKSNNLLKEDVISFISNKYKNKFLELDLKLFHSKIENIEYNQDLLLELKKIVEDCVFKGNVLFLNYDDNKEYNKLYDVDISNYYRKMQLSPLMFKPLSFKELDNFKKFSKQENKKKLNDIVHVNKDYRFIFYSKHFGKIGIYLEKYALLKSKNVETELDFNKVKGKLNNQEEENTCTKLNKRESK